MDRQITPEFGELERSFAPAGGRTVAILIFLCGLVFLVGCGWMMIEGCLRSDFSATFGLVLGVLAGLGAVYSQWRPLMLLRRTELPRGEVSPPVAVVGEDFVFRYSQKVRQSLQTDVITSLVLRERIPAPPEHDHPTPTVRDHLVAAHTEQGLEVPAGGCLQLQCVFRLPAEMDDFPVKHWPVKCVIKVRVRVRRGADYWEEFELPITLGAPSHAGKRTGAEAGYQVTLLSFPNLCRELPAPAPLDEYLPHLVQVDRLPLVLLRGITRAEADAARRTLEAAGGVVELAYEGRVIERPWIRNLPVPSETARPEIQALPIPGSTPDRSA